MAKNIRFVACMGEIRNAYRIWLGSLKRSNHAEDLGVHGKIKLEWILGK
jgi:hypothetical protein